jgi:PAS domain S-box-containing protein
MQDTEKSKKQLMNELLELRQHIAEFDMLGAEHERAQEALGESEEKYRILVEQANDGILIVQDGMIKFANRRLAEANGRTVEELINTNFLDYVRPDEVPSVANRYHRRLAGEDAEQVYETVLLHKDGHEIPVEVNAGLIMYQGSPAVFAFVRDHTERKMAEEALRESNETLRALINASPLAITAIDPESKVTMWNPAAERIFGWTEGEVLGQNLPVVPPDKSAEHLELRERAFSGDALTGVEVVRNRKDGAIIDVSVSTAPVYGSDGRIKSIMAVVEDISERKRTESALKQSEEKFRALFEHTPGIAFVIDSDTRLIAANKLRQSVFGDDIGLKALERRGAPPATREFWQSVETQVIRSGWPAWYTEIVRDRDKENRYYENRLRPIKKDGKVSMVICVAYDVTDRVKAEEIVRESEAKLRSQSEHLEEVNAALKVLLKRRDEDKQELEEKVVANVKELVLPYLQRLKESGLNPQQMTVAAILESNLREIVSPFVTRLSSRFVNLTPTELKVADLIRDGSTTKEIASLLHLSYNTIMFHRHNIRGKLGLKKKKTNLRSYLRSFQG